MKLIRQRVEGDLLSDGERTALLLRAGDEVVYVAYALTTQGIAAQIIPALLLDDWGKEITGLGLYDWVREHGPRFPRAEVFGYSPAGEAAQYFLRDMEPFARYPAYASTDAATPIAGWRPLRAALIEDATLAAPQASDAPAGLAGPLRQAALAWWRVPPWLNDLSFLDAREPLPE